jgi:general secretion pathway protein E
MDIAHILEGSDGNVSDADAPVIKLVNMIIVDACNRLASDIHLEPMEKHFRVRFRVDGALHEIKSPPKKLQGAIIQRIKIMAGMKISEKRIPQDGRIDLPFRGRSLDLRVSCIPTNHGESIVMRILDKQSLVLGLPELGFLLDDQQQFESLIKRPHGVLLVTGPTGSGKTTTLYAALERLNDRSRNIMTVEDPIEYYIDGIGQTQVNTKVDMTFARGLRAILRQDPDVVMVGEIRDLETAQIAVQASLTGHLVLSTLHTNTAVGAVTRLRDMGIEPFLLSSSLIGVVAQRLVRTLDPEARVPFVAGEYERRMLNVPAGEPAPTLYGPGREGAGYRGRTGIHELVLIDDAMRAMIHDGASELELERHARTVTPSIRDDGRARVLRGETTIEEILRVTRED